MRAYRLRAGPMRAQKKERNEKAGHEAGKYMKKEGKKVCVKGKG